MEIFPEDLLIIPSGKANHSTLAFFRELLTKEGIAAVIRESEGLTKQGIALALYRAADIVLDRGIPRTSSFLEPEILAMFQEILSMEKTLNPSPESNWLMECWDFGEKCAFHWDWKHFGSKELF